MHILTVRNDPAKLKRVANMLKRVSHPIRLLIVDMLLGKGRMPVKEIHEALGISQSNTSQHLKSLESVEILASHREGKQIFYSIQNHHIADLLECVNRCAI